MHYSALSLLQQNALVAISVAGWQWVEWDFEDCSLKEQRWLLPCVAARHDLTSGEWRWYVEEEEVWLEGSVFPLPHTDTRVVPGWFPTYFEHLESAWNLACMHFSTVEVLKRNIGGHILHYAAFLSQEAPATLCGIAISRESPSRALCEAMLQAKGVIDDHGQLVEEVIL